jgi:hypothetical protein
VRFCLCDGGAIGRDATRARATRPSLSLSLSLPPPPPPSCACPPPLSPPSATHHPAPAVSALNPPLPPPSPFLSRTGIFWASSVAGTLAFQWSKPIPTSLRIIHARVYAQAFTLAALGLAAAVDVYEHKAATAAELDAMGAKVRAIEARVKADK